MKKILVTICLVMVLFIFGCSSRSKYYIEEPKESKFSMESVSGLQSSDVELIKEFLPKVTKWYNTVDISKEQSIKFVADEVDDLGQKLFASPSWTSYLDSFATGNETEGDKENFEQISKANSIYGEIAGVIMNSEVTASISEESNITIMISEENWIKLGDCIKEAIDYYYE